MSAEAAHAKEEKKAEIKLKTNPEVVIRDITEDVVIFSAPFNNLLGLVPFGGRTVAVRIKGETETIDSSISAKQAGVWVMASTALTPETKERIDKMGEVRWIVSADIQHHVFLKEWKEVYGEAKLIGVEGLDKKEKGLKFEGLYTAEGGETKYGFEDQIKAIYFAGFANKDVLFYHVPSKSLITADLMFNLPATEAYSKSKKSAKVPLFGKLEPYGGIVPKMLFNFGKDKKRMKEDLKKVNEEFGAFERIIMAHGDVIDKAAKQAWDSAYSKYAPL